MKASWVRLGRIAFPAIVTNAVGPIAVGVLTGMVATHGADALAAWGIGARIDAVFLLLPLHCRERSVRSWVKLWGAFTSACVRGSSEVDAVCGWLGGNCVPVHYDSRAVASRSIFFRSGRSDATCGLFADCARRLCIYWCRFDLVFSLQCC